MFFSEEKNQKTFMSSLIPREWPCADLSAGARNKSRLLLFFRKEELAYLYLATMTSAQGPSAGTSRNATTLSDRVSICASNTVSIAVNPIARVASAALALNFSTGTGSAAALPVPPTLSTTYS
jgi:hypothetical protein